MEHAPLLLDLYRLARSSPPDEFQSAAFALLDRVVPFDAALWATFATLPCGVRLHSGRPYRLPGAMLEEYRPLIPNDPELRAVLAEPGRTRNAEPMASVSDAALVAHGQRWGKRQLLGTSLPLAEGLALGILLYRADRPFSEEERLLKQVLMPHLAEAMQVSTTRWLDAEPERVRPIVRSRALVDAYGVLHQAEPGLARLIALEYPRWPGIAVPPAWLTALAPGAPPHRGKRLLVRVERRLDDGTFLLGVRSLSPIDCLSPREAEIARLLAAGKTHRAIATELGTAPSTVRTQMQATYAKLGIASKAQLGRMLAELDA